MFQEWIELVKKRCVGERNRKGVSEGFARLRGKQRLGWVDGVKVALGNRLMTVEAARQCAKDRKE